MSKLLYHADPNGVVTLTLNRPEVHNAFDDELVCSLSDTLEAITHDASVRAVVITGQGDSFSAGADLNWMRRMAQASAKDNEHDALQLARLLRLINYLPRPTLARVNGAALGGGMGLVACCDIAIAADTARFGLTEARLGLAPAVISPYVFRRIGEGHARRYFLSGERFDAAHAKHIGLVQEIAAPGELDLAMGVLLEQVLKGGPQALAQCKALAFHAAGHSAERQLEMDQVTARVIAKLRTSAEGKEGMQAFLDKRTPGWNDT
jgi:methylglutaconyl-CoA hydratase